jgi:hypothetical protein
MECDNSRDVDLHQVRKVAEVGPNAANMLLESGWILHDIYFNSEGGDLHSVYVLVTHDEVVCPHCGGASKMEILDNGRRVRFICPEECPDLGSTPVLLDTARSPEL